MTAIEIEKENNAITKSYRNLLKVSYRTLTKEDKKNIRKAFDIALEAHKDQRRKSGEAYIFHPLSVARIVAQEIGLDATSIVAALLHDVVEDSDFTLTDIEQMFGKTVAKIVDGLTKISSLKKDRDISLQAENFRKMLLTLNEDIRVIIIKIADRLHNMQTMGSMRPDKQVKISYETLYIYAPLAHRIGLYNIKTELENLGLKYTEPEIYNEIENKMEESSQSQNKYIADFSDIIKKSLNEEKLSYSIKGRPKSIYSIRKKMQTQNLNFEEVYDKFAIRIIYKSDVKNEKFLAWKIYSIVTDHFTPNPTRLRDWISAPKSTGYEALHITVVGPKSRWVEVQIRSERMNEIAEKGYAAHYKYKNKEDKGDSLDVWVNKLQELLESNTTNAVDFVEQFKLNLYAKEIFVFSPKGDLISLPKGATSLDFAFNIHTEVGMKTRGARVNGKLVPLSYVLQSGDNVEILTSDNVKPNPNWLDYVTTARARSKIRTSINSEKKEIGEEGKEILRRKLKQLKISLNDKTINEMVNHFSLKTSLDLFYRVGLGTIDNSKLKEFANSRSNVLVNFFKSKIRKKHTTTDINKDEVSSNFDMLVFGKEEEKLNYILSKCCNPIPGDKVFGFITINDGIKVHKRDCPNAISMQSNFSYRIISAKWIDSTQQVFTVKLKLSGIDNMGLVKKITEVISSNYNVNIKDLTFSTDDGIFTGNITVAVKNKSILKKITDGLLRVNGIEKVVRV